MGPVLPFLAPRTLVRDKVGDFAGNAKTAMETKGYVGFGWVLVTVP
jgi:hypothetical protein